MQYAIFFNELPPYPGAYARRERAGGEGLRDTMQSLEDPHPNPLPEGEGTGGSPVTGSVGIRTSARSAARRSPTPPD